MKRLCADQPNWEAVETCDVDFDFIWTDVAMAPDRFAKLKSHQRYNHFVGMNAVSRKNNLGRNLIRMKKFFEHDYSFFPETWILPTDITDFKFNARRGRTYIVKPDNKGQGKGIYLTRDPETVQLDFNQGFVAQRYINNPFLLDGFKFDLRVYVLVSGCDPLRIFVHNEGLVRLCCSQYAGGAAELDNPTMHLTNYAVNSKSEKFEENLNPNDIHDGHKRRLKCFFEYLRDQGHDVDILIERMDDLMIKTLIAVQPTLAHVQHSCQPDNIDNNISTEILGLDILIDYKMKPWLLEVNHAPSFGADSELDRIVKAEVITDTLRSVNFDNNRVTKKNKKLKERITDKLVKCRELALIREKSETQTGGWRKYVTAQTNGTLPNQDLPNAGEGRKVQKIS